MGKPCDDFELFGLRTAREERIEWDDLDDDEAGLTRSEAMRGQTASATAATLVIGLFAAGVGGCDTNVADQMKEKKQKKQKKVESKQKKAEPEPVSRAKSYGVVTVTPSKAPGDVVDSLKKAVSASGKLSLMGAFELGSTPSESTGDAGSGATPAATVLLVGNPSLGTPLMKKSQSAGLEFPQRMLVWSADGKTRISVNAPAYLAVRHRIEKLDLFLGQMEDGLAHLIETATGASIESFPSRRQLGIEPAQGFVVAESNNSVSDTVGVLEKKIEESDEMSLLKSIDHAANAASVDRSLPNTRLLLVSTPEASSLVGANPRVGLDLPARIAVWGNRDGEILVAFDDPAYLAERHQLSGVEAPVKKLGSRLKKLVDQATKEL
ncbi:MAG: DUF302 domain-containing protein [Bradymonadaceae bacterium]